MTQLHGPGHPFLGNKTPASAPAPGTGVRYSVSIRKPNGAEIVKAGYDSPASVIETLRGIIRTLHELEE